MRRLVLVLCAVSLGCGPDWQSPQVATLRSGLNQETNFGSNPGGLALFTYVPATVRANPALLVALHGCAQSAAAYTAAGWDALADQDGFIVAYPQTVANNACFDWFTGFEQVRTGPQVTSILQMVSFLERSRGVDPSRVYATGLSAGGAMTNVLLATASDVFTRGAVMAGVPFACATTAPAGFTCMVSPPNLAPAQWGALVRQVSAGRPAPRVSIWHGSADTTVAPANQQAEVDQWTDVAAIDQTADAVTTVAGATRREYRDLAGVTLVESWTIPGMNHGTAVDPARGCGTAGAYILDVGLCSSQWAAAFFGLSGAADGGAAPDAGLADGGPVGGGTGGAGGSGGTGGAGGSGGTGGTGGSGGTGGTGGSGGTGGTGGSGGGGASTGSCGCASPGPLLPLGGLALLVLRRRRAT